VDRTERDSWPHVKLEVTEDADATSESMTMSWFEPMFKATPSSNSDSEMVPTPNRRKKGTKSV
jgi:hypothetical protein